MLYHLKPVTDLDVCNENFRSETKNGHYVFDIPTVANSSRVRVIDISNHLQSLKVCIFLCNLCCECCSSPSVNCIFSH